MTNAPAAAGQPGRDDLTMRIFRALYQHSTCTRSTAPTSPSPREPMAQVAADAP
jgi:hypothetical protein